MRIEKLVFQGVFGVESPVQLSLEDPLAHLRVSRNIGPDNLRAVLYNLLYPERRTAEHRDALEGHPEAKLALFLEVSGRRFRVVRRTAQESVRLQVDKQIGFETFAEGAAEVGEILADRLERPPVEQFHALNVWQFEPLGPPASQKPVALESLDPETRRTVEEYRESLTIEELESELGEIDAELEALRDKWGESFEQVESFEAAEAKLEDVELSSVSDEELELVRSKDERLESYEAEIDRLQGDLGRERERVERLDPIPPWKSAYLWAGLLVGCSAIGTGLVWRNSIPWVVMADAVGFGMVVWVVLKYLTDLEQVKIHKVRVDSIRRRIGEIRREMIGVREKTDHILVQADVDDDLELLERAREAEHLNDVIDTLESDVRQLRQNEAFQVAQKRFQRLKQKRAELKEARDELPPHPTDPGRLEMQLAAQGLDPDALAIAEPDESDAGVEQESEVTVDPFEVLRETAIAADQWGVGGLREKPLGLWRKVCRHVLGETFADIQLDENGALRFGDKSAAEIETWRRMHRDRERLAACSLALALHLSRYGADRHVETVWIERPKAQFPDSLGAKFEGVIASAASRSRFALLEYV